MARKGAWKKRLEVAAINEGYHDWVRPILWRLIHERNACLPKTTKDFDKLSADEKVNRFIALAESSNVGTTLRAKIGGRPVELHAGCDLGIDMQAFGTPYILTETYCRIQGAEEDPDHERALPDWPLVSSPLIQWLISQSNRGEDARDWWATQDCEESAGGSARREEGRLGHHMPMDAEDIAELLVRAITKFSEEQIGMKGAVELLSSGDPLYERRELAGHARKKLLDCMLEVVYKIAERISDPVGWYGSVWEGDYEHCTPRLAPPEAEAYSLESQDPGAEMLRRRSYIIYELNAAFAIACVAHDLGACVQGLDSDSALSLLITGEPPRASLDFLFASTTSGMKKSEGDVVEVSRREVASLNESTKRAIYESCSELFRRAWGCAITQLVEKEGLQEEESWDEELRSNVEAWRTQFETGFFSAMLRVAGGKGGRSTHKSGFYCSPKSMRASFDPKAAATDEEIQPAGPLNEALESLGLSIYDGR